MRSWRSGRTGSEGRDWLGVGFSLPEEGARGGKTFGAGSVGSGGVVSGFDVGMPSVPCPSMIPSSLDLALDPDDLGLILSVVGFDKPCSTSIGRRFENTSNSFGIFSKRVQLVQGCGFRLTKRTRISARIFSIFVE